MPHILLRSSWQTVNIGDIAHSPGVLRLLYRSIPDVKVTLWACHVDRGVDAMLNAAFPDLEIITGDVDSAPVAAAFRNAALFLHGSGPSVVAAREMDLWRQRTGKPYGLFGVTVEQSDPALVELLDGAAFIYCRDSVSVNHLRRLGVKSPVVEFGPDGVFAFDLRHEEPARRFMAGHSLEEGRFLGVIPRLRYTPYHLIHQRPATDEDRRRAQISAVHRDHDLALLRDAITAWVRETGQRVLIAPEMTYEVELGRELATLLPQDVRAAVVCRESFWLPDEAASVYARATALLSCEMHSPIIAVAAGIPAIYVRQPSDTCKGQMWRDLGMSDWIFEIDSCRAADITAELARIAAAPQQARAIAAAAGQTAATRFAAALETVAAVVNHQP